MSGLKRVALSFAAVLIAVAFVGLMGFCSAIRYGFSYTLRTFEILPVFLLFALPGWLLALPLVFRLKHAEGTRAWLILALGTAIGPAVIGTWTMLSSHGHLTWQADGFSLLMSAWIAFLTSAAYVILLLICTPKDQAPRHG